MDNDSGENSRNLMDVRQKIKIDRKRRKTTQLMTLDVISKKKEKKCSIINQHFNTFIADNANADAPFIFG